MPPDGRRLGKLPARFDERVMLLRSAQLGTEPPDQIDWYADIGLWPMLANDKIGDCAWAAAGHAVLQTTTYAGRPAEMSDQDVISAYRACTGFDPADPSSDKGTYIKGPGGLIEYWARHGLPCAGRRIMPDGFATCDPQDTRTIRQMIHIFGGVMLGFRLPESAFSDGFLWRSDGSVFAGGHEVWVDGVITTASERIYNLVSWGATYRCTEAFLVRYAEEVDAVFCEDSINARGVDGAGIPREILRASLDLFRPEAF